MTLKIEIEDRINTEHANHPNAPLATESGKALALTIHETSSNMGVVGGGGSAENHAAWHYRGCPGSDQKPTQKSWHFTVDEGPIIYQSMPVEGVNGGTYTAIAWHSSDLNTPLGGNVSTVGIEICSNRGAEQFRQALDNAANLCVQLYELGHATNSITGEGPILKMHRDWSGKRCPLGMISDPTLWDYFLTRVEYWKTSAAVPFGAPRLESLPDLSGLKPPTAVTGGHLPASQSPEPTPPQSPRLHGSADLSLGKQKERTLMTPKLQNTQRNVMKSGPEFMGSTSVAGAVGLINSLIPDGLPVEAMLGIVAGIPPIIYMTRRYIRDLLKALKEMRKMVEDI